MKKVEHAPQSQKPLLQTWCEFETMRMSPQTDVSLHGLYTARASSVEEPVRD